MGKRIDFDFDFDGTYCRDRVKEFKGIIFRKCVIRNWTLNNKLLAIKRRCDYLVDQLQAQLPNRTKRQFMKSIHERYGELWSNHYSDFYARTEASFAYWDEFEQSLREMMGATSKLELPEQTIATYRDRKGRVRTPEGATAYRLAERKEAHKRVSALYIMGGTYDQANRK